MLAAHTQNGKVKGKQKFFEKIEVTFCKIWLAFQVKH